MACSASVSSQARSAIRRNGSTTGSASLSRAVEMARLASIHFAVARCPSNSRALSIATAAADANARTTTSSDSLNVDRDRGSVR